MNPIKFTGIKEDVANKVSSSLNILLADYHVFYINLRGLHWNIKGQRFFALHEKFEELYDDVAEKIDEIAERILSLGNTPLHSMSKFIENAGIKEAINVSDSEESIMVVLENFKHLIAEQRKIMELADGNGDEATNAMMSDYISGQEKEVWLLSSSLRK
ncbi:MAG TPA: Dps family protein [Bacteroidales bacterium]|jgi:starvation-inducible DNA-binding protein|nr:DNA starvation/stationary phase protection protein [Bacteroidales bacterium]MDY0160719.1 Dps family protein [Bacteroidales bacterium]HXK81777.1 Dps family protein [Bacteroidales bacterium]